MSLKNFLPKWLRSWQPKWPKLIVLALGLALAVAFALMGPGGQKWLRFGQPECASAGSCVVGDTSHCAAGSSCDCTTVVDVLSGRVLKGTWCDWQWSETNVPVSCNENCSYTWSNGNCSCAEDAVCYSCTGPSKGTTNCCGGASVPTATSAPPPATATPMPTSTPTPTATPTPMPPSASLTAKYGALVLYGPKLGLPAQTLNGQINNGTAPYSVTLFVKDPDSNVVSYSPSLVGTTFSFGPGDAGDTYFGVAKLGLWHAWFTVTDSIGRNATSNTVAWEVVFYPVHELP